MDPQTQQILLTTAGGSGSGWTSGIYMSGVEGSIAQWTAYRYGVFDNNGNRTAGGLWKNTSTNYQEAFSYSLDPNGVYLRSDARQSFPGSTSVYSLYTDLGFLRKRDSAFTGQASLAGTLEGDNFQSCACYFSYSLSTGSILQSQAEKETRSTNDGFYTTDGVAYADFPETVCLVGRNTFRGYPTVFFLDGNFTKTGVWEETASTYSSLRVAPYGDETTVVISGTVQLSGIRHGNIVTMSYLSSQVYNPISWRPTSVGSFSSTLANDCYAIAWRNKLTADDDAFAHAAIMLDNNGVLPNRLVMFDQGVSAVQTSPITGANFDCSSAATGDCNRSSYWYF